MSRHERAVAGLGSAWGANICLIWALNPHDVTHCASILLLFTAVYFLFLAPVHALLAGIVWAAHRVTRDTPAEAAERWLTAESFVFWLLYWGMVLEFVPLHLRV